jgi:outer membrane protein OmpA-like peptidoglycan-associated protein
VRPDTAEDDLRTLLEGVAQANLADNVRAFSNVSAVVNRLLQTRNLWAATGHNVPGGDVTAIVNPEFVQASARSLQVDLNATNQFVNNTFSLGRSLAVVPLAASSTVSGTAVAPPEVLSTTQTVATLPCSRFEFVPNSTQLEPQSQQELLNCAVRVLQQNLFLYVRVKGSSAWPGPKGAITQDRVESTARLRAESVVNFLVAQGINRDRFTVEWTLPPPDHRETTDVAKQAQDRYVEISLLTAGL